MNNIDVIPILETISSVKYKVKVAREASAKLMELTNNPQPELLARYDKVISELTDIAIDIDNGNYDAFNQDVIEKYKVEIADIQRVARTL